MTPWLGAGSVRDLLDAHLQQGLGEVAVAFVVRDIAKALSYLHDNVREKDDVTRYSSKRPFVPSVSSTAT